MKTPVLIVAFNRPDLAQKVIDAVIEAGARNVYVALDGPRVDRPEDNTACAEVRSIVERAQWPGNIQLLPRTENLGCKKSVSGAITWFLDQAGEGIILEDDCLPSPSFFGYCTHFLERYRDSPDVGTIVGTHFKPLAQQGPERLFFSRFGLCSGWATWQRAWDAYDGEMLDWWDLRDTSWLKDTVHGHSDAAYAWRLNFDNCAAGRIDSWAWPWMYSLWRANLKSLHSNRNLVLNIGFDSRSTHTFDPSKTFQNTRLQHLDWAGVADPAPDIDQSEDRWIDRHHWQTRRAWNPIRRALRPVKHMLMSTYRSRPQSSPPPSRTPSPDRLSLHRSELE